MTIQKVTIVGANGRLGPAILNALLSTNTFTVTVLSRSSSKSTYPSPTQVNRISDDFPMEELVSALRGQDALVVVFAGTNDELQIRLADAAATAGVKRFIPADFGSCDSSSERALELMPLYVAKKKVRQHLEELESQGLSWTSLVCGHFFDYGLKSGLLQFDLGERKVNVFDGGEIKWSATTTGTIARAVVRVLQKEDQTQNRMLYIQSFCLTQNEVTRSLERAMGQKWEVEQSGSHEYIRHWKAEADNGDGEATERLVSVLGIVDANWEGKKDFANGLLGLETEDLDQVVRKVVSEK